MIEQHHLSERHACRLVGLSRDSYRHPPQPSELNASLGEQIRQTALVRRRFGYRRIHDMLREQFPGVNHKRIYRLYRQANLTVKKRRKAKRPAQERVPLQLARNINEVLSMDFVSDSLSSGRRIKCLTVVDDFNKESVDITVDYGISGQYSRACSIKWQGSAATRQQCERTMVRSSPVGRSWLGRTRTEFGTS